MDKNMIQRVSTGYKKLMEENPGEINKDNYYFIVDGKESDAWDTVKWNAIDFDGEEINSIEVYKKYQEMAKVIADKVSKDTGIETSPIELAFIEWDV